VSALLFQNKLTLINIFGFSICFAGLFLYAWLHTSSSATSADAKGGDGDADGDERGYGVNDDDSEAAASRRSNIASIFRFFRSGAAAPKHDEARSLLAKDK
jgi:hypothetical protein